MKDWAGRAGQDGLVPVLLPFVPARRQLFEYARLGSCPQRKTGAVRRRGRLDSDTEITTFHSNFQVPMDGSNTLAGSLQYGCEVNQWDTG